MVDVAGGCVGARLDDAGVAEDYGMGGNVAVDVGVGGDEYVVADGDATHDSGVDTNPNLVADGGDTLSRASVLLTDGYALVDVAVAAYGGLRINGNAVGMADVKAWAYTGRCSDFYVVNQA